MKLPDIMRRIETHDSPVIITSVSGESDAVLVSKKAYDAYLETIALIANGQLLDAMQREGEESVELDQVIQNLDHMMN